jgi:hypothetical protein
MAGAVRFTRRMSPDLRTREGRRLANGTLTVTVVSRVTGDHLTLRFCAKRRGGRWQKCEYAKASHVFIECLDGSPVGTFYPQASILRFDPRASEAARWAGMSVLRAVCGAFPTFSRHATMYPSVRCRRCRRVLTDPESIERRAGPECWGEPTHSRAVAAHAA